MERKFPCAAFRQSTQRHETTEDVVAYGYPDPPNPRCSCPRSGCRGLASPATEPRPRPAPSTSRSEIPTATGRCKAIHAPPARRGPAPLIFKRAWLSSRAALLWAAFSRRPRHQIHISWIKEMRIWGPGGSCFSRPATRPIPISPLRRAKTEECSCSIPPTWGSRQTPRRRQARRPRWTHIKLTLAGVDHPFSRGRTG